MVTQEKSNNHRYWRQCSLTVCGVLLLASLGCSALTAGSSAGPAPTTQPASSAAAANTPITASQPAGNSAPLSLTGNLETDVRAVAERDRPAVVFVGIEATLGQFNQPVPVGNGSGAIIDKDGHIITNN